MSYYACEMLNDKSGDISVFFESGSLDDVLDAADNAHFNLGLSVEIVENLGTPDETTIHMYI